MIDILPYAHLSGISRTNHRHRFRKSARYTIANGNAFNLESFVDYRNLKAAYDQLKTEGGPAPGIDGVTYEDLSRHEVSRMISACQQALRSGNYQPRPTRSAKIPKGEGQERELNVAVIADRTIGKALCNCCLPWLRTAATFSKK